MASPPHAAWHRHATHPPSHALTHKRDEELNQHRRYLSSPGKPPSRAPRRAQGASKRQALGLTPCKTFLQGNSSHQLIPPHPTLLLAGTAPVPCPPTYPALGLHGCSPRRHRHQKSSGRPAVQTPPPGPRTAAADACNSGSLQGVGRSWTMHEFMHLPACGGRANRHHLCCIRMSAPIPSGLQAQSPRAPSPWLLSGVIAVRAKPRY
jgi:hypothetical protein